MEASFSISEEWRKNNRKTKKKTIHMPQHRIDIILGYKGIPAGLQVCVDSDPSVTALFREASEAVLARQKIVM
jgi:hypothetical protein